MSNLDFVIDRIRSCRLCADELPHEPRPVLRASETARLCVVGQAPGTRVHETGIPFNDRSGDRLRDWMGIGPDIFYDELRVAIVPMGFCFPGQDDKGGDLPPRRECAATWRDMLFEELPSFDLVLLVGSYAQRWHLGKRAKPSLSETVESWRDFAPTYVPLPHPSWRNNAWIKRHAWFEKELVPELQQRVANVLELPC
jgi:uracil-DNA glycosylase